MKTMPCPDIFRYELSYVRVVWNCCRIITTKNYVSITMAYKNYNNNNNNNKVFVGPPDIQYGIQKKIYN